MELKRVFAVNDISGFGKCALTIAIPVISACGVEVCPIITSVLSTNTKFSGFQLTDFTESMPNYTKHWLNLGIQPDALYCGFLSSYAQADIVIDIIDNFKPALTVIDPIMGDNGTLYKTFDLGMVEKMRQLVSHADIVMPNLTEACFLADIAYNKNNLSLTYIQSIADKLMKLGAKNVILKGMEADDYIFSYLISKGKIYSYKTKRHPFQMFGTGDLFASVFVGKVLTGETYETGIRLAADFVYEIMELSVQYDDYENRGLCFEPYLYKLCQKISL